MSTEFPNSEVKLRRVLTLSDLVIYGIILIQPVAALPLFGHANNISQGHATTTIVIAMLAMIFTAISYGRMANKYPAAGSAYTYVGKGLSTHLGFIAGWCMFLDYLIVPIICTIYCSITAHHLIPFIPYIVWIVFFITNFTILNLNGIKVTSRTNWVLMIIMSVVVFYFMAAALRYILVKNGFGGLFTIQPFYHEDSFSWNAIWSGTALAALTYIGFDGITTLSEEVENPRRNVLLATVLTCVITGIWSGAQVYLAQASWPDWMSFTQGLTDQAARNNALDTAIISVARRVGGGYLDSILTVVLLVASVGSGVTAQVGAARLLYGMGRDKVLPNKFFAHLDKKHAGPSYNVMFIGVLALFGALIFNYEECARLINFGAFLAFIGVNAASIREYFFHAKEKTMKGFLLNFLPSTFGAVFCFILWKSLPWKTFAIGGSWMIVGIIYLAIKTNGFRKKPEMIGFSEM